MKGYKLNMKAKLLNEANEPIANGNIIAVRSTDNLTHKEIEIQFNKQNKNT